MNTGELSVAEMRTALDSQRDRYQELQEEMNKTLSENLEIREGLDVSDQLREEAADSYRNEREAKTKFDRENQVLNERVKALEERLSKYEKVEQVKNFVEKAKAPFVENDAEKHQQYIDDLRSKKYSLMYNKTKTLEGKTVYTKRTDLDTKTFKELKNMSNEDLIERQDMINELYGKDQEAKKEQAIERRKNLVIAAGKLGLEVTGKALLKTGELAAAPAKLSLQGIQGGRKKLKEQLTEYIATNDVLKSRKERLKNIKNKSKTKVIAQKKSVVKEGLQDKPLHQLATRAVGHMAKNTADRFMKTMGKYVVPTFKKALDNTRNRFNEIYNSLEEDKTKTKNQEKDNDDLAV